MIRGIYTAATGMINEMNRQEVVANNLANTETVGFKRDNVTSVPFEEMLINAYSKQGQHPIGKLGLGVQATTTFVDFSDAPRQETGNPLDLAIVGPGVFAAQGPNGIRYTRAGNFAVSKDGYLVTQEGYRVLGKNGPIQVDRDFKVLDKGEIIKKGQVVDQLMVYDPAGLVKEGQYSYTGNPGKPAQNYQIIQGTLETSNVNTIREMIQMITVSRSYETNQKALSMQDDTLGRAVNDLAK